MSVLLFLASVGAAAQVPPPGARELARAHLEYARGVCDNLSGAEEPPFHPIDVDRFRRLQERVRGLCLEKLSALSAGVDVLAERGLLVPEGPEGADPAALRLTEAYESFRRSWDEAARARERDPDAAAVLRDARGAERALSRFFRAFGESLGDSVARLRAPAERTAEPAGLP